MTIDSFFKFPGILVTIGIILLIISIMIILIAVKSDKKEDFKIKNDDFKNDDFKDENQKVPEESTLSYDEPQNVSMNVNVPQEVPKIKVSEAEPINNNEEDDIELL